jgi:hypothetical protein
LLESFAAGVLCVMSEIAAEGIPLPPALLALIGKDAATLAGLIRLVHADVRTNDAAAQAGIRMILETSPPRPPPRRSPRRSTVEPRRRKYLWEIGLNNGRVSACCHFVRHGGVYE